MDFIENTMPLHYNQNKIIKQIILNIHCCIVFILKLNSKLHQDWAINFNLNNNY